jgi:hypothetical protein
MARRVPADLVLALRGYALRDATTLTATSLFTLKSDPMGSQEISNDGAPIHALTAASAISLAEAAAVSASALSGA